MTVFTAVSSIFQNVSLAIVAANRLDRAYAVGVGHPEYHPADFGLDEPEKVAMSVAGLYAADTAANLLAPKGEDGKPSEADYLVALRRIAAGDLTPGEKYIAKNIANATWRAGQPFRDMAKSPLSRLTRGINAQFNTLPPDEEDKDLVQVKEGASFLLEEIQKLVG